MKIAFENTLPDKHQMERLIRRSGLQEQWSAESLYDDGGVGGRFVSAYDCDELVGFGRLVGGKGREGGDSGDGDLPGRLDIVVLPHYRNRDIVATIFRLLSTRRNPAAQRALQA